MVGGSEVKETGRLASNMFSLHWWIQVFSDKLVVGCGIAPEVQFLKVVPQPIVQGRVAPQENRQQDINMHPCNRIRGVLPSRQEPEVPISPNERQESVPKMPVKAEENRLDAVAEAGAVLVAGVRQGLIKADVLAGALRQHMHLLAALRPRQLIAVVLDQDMHTRYSLATYRMDTATCAAIGKAVLYQGQCPSTLEKAVTTATSRHNGNTSPSHGMEVCKNCLAMSATLCQAVKAQRATANYKGQV